MRLKIAALVACITASGYSWQVGAQDLKNTVKSETTKDTFDDYLKDKERGWYFYESLPEDVKEEIRKRDNRPTTIPKATKPEDKPLSQAWFRKNFEKYRDQAIENPNDTEAMRNYLYLEKYMRDRAVQFGYARQKQVYADPFLDQTTKRSTANFGSKPINKEASKNRQSLLTEIGDKAGIFFFFRSDCPFCHKQMPLIALLEKNFGFTIKPVSLDGKPLPDSPWEKFYKNSGQAEALGVLKVPAMYLYEPETNSFELIGMGLQSLSQLEKRTVYAASRSGLITEEQFNTIKPTNQYQSPDGSINELPVPENAPEMFKQLYQQSLAQQ